jgi:hypothetical protein
VIDVEEHPEREQNSVVRAIARKVAQRDAEPLDRLSR